MKKIRLLLLKFMGEEKYLYFVATTFQRLYRTGRLGKEYQDVYFLKEFIKEGDTCIDIGAHLGYYSLELSRLAGQNGSVISIEPVSKFYAVLQKLISSKNSKNIRLVKVAIGGEGKVVEIGIPRINKEKKFGYARLRQMNEYLEYAESERVDNVRGDEIFANETRIDFVKCDVEGAEVPVFHSMLASVEKHKPVILAELADKNERIKLYNLLSPFGYEVYLLRDKKLLKIDVHSDEKAISHNHYFIPEERLSRFS